MSEPRVPTPTWLTPLLLVVVACGKQSSPEHSADREASPSAPQTPLVWQIDFRSVGLIRIGMSVAEASAALGEPLEVPPPEESLCQWSDVRPSKSPPGLWLTVSHDTIVRIDVDSAGLPTVDGLQVGSTIDDIAQKYDTLIQRDGSLGGGPKFTLASKEPERAFLIIYRTDGARVIAITSGRRLAAQVEECV
jgi:hypothetical protein